MSGSERPADLRLVPAAVSAWVAMWLATSSQVWLLVAGGVVGAACVVLAHRCRSWPLAAAGIVVLGCMLAGAARWAWIAADPVTPLVEQRAVAEVELVVHGSPATGGRAGPRPPWWSSAARVEVVAARGEVWRSGAPARVMASGDAVPAWSAIVPGTRVRAAVRLEPAEAGDAEVMVLRAREPPRVLAPPGRVDEVVERVRGGLRASVAGLADEPRALVPALVVGDTSAMPQALVEEFRVTGLTHLTAVSGANLTLMLAFLGVLARWVGVRGWWLRGLLVVGVLFFVLLCRAEPSVVRAAGMGLVGLAALGAGARGGNGVRALCVAVVVVLFIDPGMARSVGFALSVLASAGLVAWARSWSDLLARWLPGWLAEGLATPLAAQLATQPVVTALSGQISVVGLLANLVAGPLVGPATVLGFAAAVGAQLWLPIGIAFGALAGWCAQALCWTAKLGGLFPGAVLPWPGTPVAVVVVGAACAGLTLVLPRLLARPVWAGAAAVLLLVLMLRPLPPPGWPPAGWVAVFCDVGQGDTTVLRAGNSQAVVVDAGPDPAPVARCLRELGVGAVPIVLLTHFHSDHITGLPKVVGSGTEAVLVSAALEPVSGRAAVVRDAGAARVREVGPGTVVRVGELSIEVLAVRPAAAGGGDDGESAAANNGSLVLRATVAGVRVLLPGDVEEEGQRHALAAVADLSADVLLVPHHGSGRQLPEFLAATGADVAVMSCGVDNDYGHPAPRTLRALQGLGMTTARTDLQGSVAISLREGRMVLTTQR